MGTLGQHPKYALAALRKDVGFRSITVLILTLGVGASTAVFGVLRAVVLAPLPYPQPDRLVMVWTHLGRGGRADGGRLVGCPAPDCACRQLRACPPSREDRSHDRAPASIGAHP